MIMYFETNMTYSVIVQIYIYMAHKKGYLFLVGWWVHSVICFWLAGGSIQLFVSGWPVGPFSYLFLVGRWVHSVICFWLAGGSIQLFVSGWPVGPFSYLFLVGRWVHSIVKNKRI